MSDRRSALQLLREAQCPAQHGSSIQSHTVETAFAATSKQHQSKPYHQDVSAAPLKAGPLRSRLNKGCLLAADSWLDSCRLKDPQPLREDSASGVAVPTLLVASGCSMPLAVGDSAPLSVASDVLLAPAPNQCPALQLA